MTSRRPTISDVARRRGRVEGCGVLRAQRPARAWRRRPGTGSSRWPASWAGRRATGPAPWRPPGRWPSAWSSPARRRPSARTRSSRRSSPASSRRSSPLGQSLLLQVVPDRRPRAGRLPAAGRRRPGRRRLPHRPAGRRPAPRAARRGRPARRSGSVRTASAAACPASPSTTGPGIAAAVAHLVELGHRHIAHVAGPDEFVHGVSRREAWAGALRGRGPARGAVRPFRLLGPGRRRRHQGAARPAGPAHRDRLRQRPDGHRRHGGSRSPAASTCPRDLSITGFDDTEVTAHLQPPLTTVRTDAYALGHGRGPAADGRGRGHGPPTTPSCRRRTSSSEPPPHPRAPIPRTQRPETENR